MAINSQDSNVRTTKRGLLCVRNALSQMFVPASHWAVEAASSLYQVSSLTEDFGSVEYFVCCVVGGWGAIKGGRNPLVEQDRMNK